MNSLLKLFFILLLTSPAHGLIKTGVMGVDANSYGSINAAVAAIGNASLFLNVSSSQTLAGSLTIPSNVTLRMQKGGLIIKASTYTLTINGDFQAGLQSCFSGFSSGNVNFANISHVMPQWWGAKGDGSNADGVPLQRAIDTKQHVRIPAGTYKIGTGLTVGTQGQIISGEGKDLTVIITTATIDMMTVTERFVEIRDLYLNGRAVATRGVLSTIPKTKIVNSHISSTTVAAIDLKSFTAFIDHNNIFTNYGDGIILSSGGFNNDVVISNNVISGGGKNGINITAGTPSFSDGIFIYNNDMENNTSSGTASVIYSDILIGNGSRSVKIDNNYFESDNSQTGFGSQKFVSVGEGCENISMRNNYMLSSASNKRNYYIEVGTSSYPVQIENCSLKGFATAAIRDFTGANGRLIQSLNVIGASAPQPMVYITGGVDFRNGLIVSTATTQAPSLAVGTSSVTFRTNYVVQPRQPSFLATAPINTTNVTGDGTTFDIEYDTEITDRGNNYDAATTYTMTSPVTGSYDCSASALLTNVDASHTGTTLLIFVTSNRNYIVQYYGNTFEASLGSGNVWANGSVSEIDMDSGDTIKATIRVAGGTKTVELLNDADFNKFSCTLIN